MSDPDLLDALADATRFWCCFEGFFAIHKAFTTGVAIASVQEVEARAIFCELGAAAGQLERMFEGSWRERTVSQTMEALRKDDIQVTNMKDKEVLIPKMEEFERRVQELFNEMQTTGQTIPMSRRPLTIVESALLKANTLYKVEDFFA